jgi:uncharacterized protein YbjT (DUF2867 family)
MPSHRKREKTKLQEAHMYVITGATGNTGHIAAKRLLEQGKKVRVIGRRAEKLAALTALGTEGFVADLTDKDAVVRAFAGAEAAYVMLPPNLGSTDLRAYQKQLIEAMASAIEKNGVKYVVALSSFGADKPAGTGPIVGLHDLEERLKGIPGLNTLSLRAGYFMENTLLQAAVIQMMGVIAGPLTPDLKVPMIASRDIGATAGDALLRLDFKGFQAQELHGQRDLTMPEVATIIGKAIGKPDLKYQQLTYEQFGGAVQQMGVSANVAGLFMEMSQAENTGHVTTLEPRSPRNTTPTSYEQFVAEEFVPTYEGKSAA